MGWSGEWDGMGGVRVATTVRSIAAWETSAYPSWQLSGIARCRRPFRDLMGSLVQEHVPLLLGFEDADARMGNAVQAVAWAPVVEVLNPHLRTLAVLAHNGWRIARVHIPRYLKT